MIAKGITEAQLIEAAESIGVCVSIGATLNQSGTRHRVKVNPGEVPRSAYGDCRTCGGSGRRREGSAGPIPGATYDATCPRCDGRGHNFYRRAGEAGDNKYQRTSAAVTFYDERRVAAVCWHGFRDFFRACFERAPDAIFRTSLDTWAGSEDFEERFRASGSRNVGAPIAPITACEVCRCPDAGRAN